jgi:CelD/BcsL family acetyltransferase involved in cellulose biosynthesis
LREEWRALQAQCPEATPYQTWEWNAAWWRHFGARKRAHILTFRTERGALVGIAPFYVSRHLGTPLRRLAWMGTGPSDYLGPLVLPEFAGEVASALLDYLAAGMRGWDMADLQQLPPASPLMAHAPYPWPERPADTQSVLPMEPCPYLPLSPTWEELTKRLGKKMRSNLGYYERLLHKTFPDARYFLADAQTLDAGMSALFALHQSRWNARWLPGVLGNKRVQAFHREVAARFLEGGRLRLHLLYADGAIRSALYCFSCGGRLLYYLGGFAPEMSRYSLGTLLTAHAIREAIEEGCTEFDFLRGSEPYKYRWQPEERVNSRLLLLRSRGGLGRLGELPGKAGFALTRVERYIVHRAKAFAEQQGRKERGAEQTSSARTELADNETTAQAVVRVRADTKSRNQ